MPVNVVSTAGNGSAVVTFDAPVYDGGSPILAYTVSAQSTGGAAGVDLNAGTSSRTHTITGLTNGVVYTFTVTAINAAGTSDKSVESNKVIPSALPGAPIGVYATPGTGQAIVTFAPPAFDGGSPVTGYVITSTPDNITVVTSTSSPVTITKLKNGTPYTFTVRAVNSMGTGPVSTPSNSITLGQLWSLTTNFSGTGSGSINGDVNCATGSNCSSVAFQHGVAVTLIPTPDFISTFGGWSGACTNTTGNCMVSMDGNKAVTATFNAAPKAKVGTKSFSIIQAAYDDSATSDDSVIKLLEGSLANTLIANRSVRVKLEGATTQPTMPSAPRRPFRGR